MEQKRKIAVRVIDTDIILIIQTGFHRNARLKDLQRIHKLSLPIVSSNVIQSPAVYSCASVMSPPSFVATPVREVASMSVVFIVG